MAKEDKNQFEFSMILDLIEKDKISELKKLFKSSNEHYLRNLFEISDHSGRTLLMHVASRGNGDLLELFLSNGCRLDAQDMDGRTALHDAVTFGYEKVVKSLLEAGIDPDVSDKFGDTALIEAVQHEQRRVIPILIDFGASLFISNNDNLTPRDIAEDLESDEILKMLKNAGAYKQRPLW